MPVKEKVLSVPDEGPIPDGVLLRARRKSLNLSAYKLSQESGFSRGNISNFENGGRKTGGLTLEKLESFLGISAEDLRGMDKEQVKKWLEGTGRFPFTLKMRTKEGIFQIKVLDAEIISGAAILDQFIVRQRRRTFLLETGD
jgi:transcriptional regulator with XRE-family HTH domain